MRKIILTLTLAVFSLDVMAAQAPRPLASDYRIRVVPYDPDNVVKIKGSTMTTTQISFNKDEIIEDIQSGDVAAWTLDVQKQLPNMLFLKPTMSDSNTNMTVVTNQHTYYFHLSSTDNPQIIPTYAIRFTYPDEEKAALLKQLNFQKQQQQALVNVAQNPKNYNWNYSFSGSPQVLPLHVFDDGQFTYMQLRPGQPVPAVFAVDNKAGHESVVNYRRDGEYLIVQQISPEFTLRDGKDKVTSIFNNKVIQQLRQQGVA